MTNAAPFMRSAAICAALVAFFAPRPLLAETPAPWSWHRDGQEIHSPAFSPDGREVAVTLKVHIPDGHEAESETQAQTLERRNHMEAQIRKDPRAFDPVVTIVKLADGKTERVDFGYEPAFAPDGASLAFQFQKKPISGFRALARTMAGNEIRIWDRKTRRTRVLAAPTQGSFGSPSFAPDGRTVAFGLQEAVNGAYGGMVGIGRVDLATGKVVFPFARRTEHGFVCIVGSFRFIGRELLAHVLVPRTSDGIGMANEYRDVLVAIGPPERLVYEWPTDDDSFGERTFSAWNDGGVAIYDENWKALRDAPKMPRKEKRNDRIGSGVLSPDGRLRAREFASGIVVTDAATGREVAAFKGPRSSDPDLIADPEVSGEGSLEGITWSADSKRLAWVEVAGYFGTSGDVLKVAKLK